MYSFNVTPKGWLITKSDSNELFINLSNVKTIQTYIDNNNETFPFVIMLEMSNSELTQNDKYETFWGHENPIVFQYTEHQKPLWEELVEKIKKAIS